ncbi:MAG: FumA C-terminus/TtdB family hydratase beta subunit [bacterium]|nr:FumA C-terminus/TtdB family hydratase beta subunit [bacterium]
MASAEPLALTLPLSRSVVQALRAGQHVLLTGEVYTARDAAHQRLIAALAAGAPTPIPLADATIYYTGPTPARPGGVIGAAGPTTAYRMDPYTVPLLRAGVRATIGKGARSLAVRAALQEYCAVYFAAIGGAGALLATCITACQPVAYFDLGPEAIHRLVVTNFPVIVAHDAHGGNAYVEPA